LQISRKILQSGGDLGPAGLIVYWLTLLVRRLAAARPTRLAEGAAGTDAKL